MTEVNLIDAFCNRIVFDKERLKNNELGRIEVDSFSLSEFWTQFGAAVQSLNNEVTKIGFMCGKKPFPPSVEVGAMMQNLLQYYTVMRDLYLVLPLEVGATLFKEVTSAIAAILESLLGFVKSLNDLSEKGAKERLTLIGTFWDACNAVDSLPKDNLQATLKMLQNEVNLASDAQDELVNVSTCATVDDEAIKLYQENKKVSLLLGERKLNKSFSTLESKNICLKHSTKTDDEFYREIKIDSNEIIGKRKTFIFGKSIQNEAEYKADKVVTTSMTVDI